MVEPYKALIHTIIVKDTQVSTEKLLEFSATEW